MKRLKLRLMEGERKGKIKYKRVNDDCIIGVGDRFIFRHSRSKLWEVIKVTCL